jgi:ribose transport system permease protein
MKKNNMNIVKRIVGIGFIPLGTLCIILIVCLLNGVTLFETGGNWLAYYRAAASALLITYALSINLNSSRFDFSIGSIALLSSVMSATLSMKTGLPTEAFLILSVTFGVVLGMVSGIVYVIVKLPPIIVSLGVALFFEGLAFTITGGYGVSFVANQELTSFPSVTNYLLIIAISVIIIIFIFDYTKFGYDYKALISGQKVAVNTGIQENRNAILCYGIAGGLMGIVGFISATNTGTIQMALNFGSIGAMFSAFLPMFIGGYIGKFCNVKIGYLIGALSTALLSLAFARLNVDSSVQQIITALTLVLFLIYLNNQKKLAELFKLKK